MTTLEARVPDAGSGGAVHTGAAAEPRARARPPRPPARAGLPRAYLELTKPGITRMVVVTTAAGFYMAARGGIDWFLLLHTLVATALVASGCNAFNQILERDADARMKRTARRPLPSGRLGTAEAYAFSVFISAVGLVQLVVFVNLLTAVLVAASLASYVWIYTPMKKATWVATWVGAVPGALPILAGWTAAGGGLDAVGWALFAILFLWQMPHFFALAWIYRDDYSRGGFRMLTVVDPSGRRSGRQAVLFALLLIPASLLPSVLGVAGQLYLGAALILGVAFTALAVRHAMRRTDRDAWGLFIGSIAYLPLLLLLLAIDKLPY
ncbi:MAG: heme o synthase [Gemmatimonadota bacterium]